MGDSENKIFTNAEEYAKYLVYKRDEKWIKLAVELLNTNETVYNIIGGNDSSHIDILVDELKKRYREIQLKPILTEAVKNMNKPKNGFTLK